MSSYRFFFFSCIPEKTNFVFLENLYSHYRREGEIERDVKGDSTFEVVAQEVTTFLILVGIYFPSVTGETKLLNGLFFSNYSLNN